MVEDEEQPSAGSRPWGAFLLAVATLSWASNIVIGRLIHAEIPPVGLAFWRWAVAFAVLLPFTFNIVRRHGRVLRREWKLILSLGVLGTGAFHALMYVSLNTTTATNVALIVAATPLFVPVFAWIILGQAVSRRQMAGTALSLIGVWFIITRGNLVPGAGLQGTPGDLLMTLAVVFWSLYVVLLKLRPADLHPMALLTATAAVAMVFLLPAYGLETALTRPVPVTWTSILTIGFVAVFSSALAYPCFNRSIDILGPALGGLGMHLIPVFTTVMAIFFLGERLYAFHAFGIAAIVTGLVLAAAPKGRAKPNSAGRPPRGA